MIYRYHLDLHQYKGYTLKGVGQCLWPQSSNQKTQKSITRMFEGNKAGKSSDITQGGVEVSLGEGVNASIELCAKPSIFERLALVLVNSTNI